MLTSEQLREVDRRASVEFGVSSLLLMENAGRGAAELLFALGIHGPVAICCGKGNNGGDGLVMARHLYNFGVPTTVFLFAKVVDLSPDAAVQWNTIEKMRIPAQVWPEVDEDRMQRELKRMEWIVDALFGTGLKGPLHAPMDRVVTVINASQAKVFAVDIPSGLNADTGEPLGPTIRARHTATFFALKKGFRNPAAKAWLGRVHLVGIGAPRQLTSE